MVPTALPEQRGSLLTGPDGRFRPGAWIALHIGFGLLMGFGIRVIWWLRTGEGITLDGTIYSLQFGTYNTVAVAAMHLLVLRRSTKLAWIVGGTVACIVAFIVMRWAGDQWLRAALGLRPNYTPDITFLSFALDNILYALLPVGFGTLVFLAERQLMHHLQRAELAYRERASELDLLHARMAPHFLYNTLNSLYALSQRPGTDLGPAIMDLSDLMRYMAKHQERTVALGTELEQVQHYIALQRLRYERPLHIRIDIPAEAMALSIPSMLLLPLVENAFKHGDPCDTAIPLVLEAHLTGPILTIRCTNRIGKTVHDGSPRTGNTHLQRRMELLFGAEGSASFTENDVRYVATLRFPVDS